MTEVSIADAEVHLGKLLDRVEAGETIYISRDGRTVARLAPVSDRRKPIDVAALKALTDGQKLQDESAADLVRAMRDGDRS